MGAIIGSVVGGLLGMDAADSAADAQRDAAKATAETNKYIFDKQVELQQPFRETGVTANNRLAQLMGLVSGGDANGSLMQTFDASKMYDDPGYQFRLNEGMKGLENSAVARGGLLSGAAMKAIQKYGQEYASGEYQNAFNRFNANQTNQYNRLAGLVNTGMGATNQIGNAAAQYGQNVANTNAALGNAQAAGAIGQANAITGGISQGVNAYQNNQLMKYIREPWLVGTKPTAGLQPTIESYYGY